MTPANLELERHGAERLAGAAVDVVGDLLTIADRAAASAGTRLHGDARLARLFDGKGPIGDIAARRLGLAAKPVRAILFDKSPQANWALGWHQDRTIAVRERHDVPGFGLWTVKRGMLHVAPPVELLERMLTVRVHLDDVPADNAPLLVAPGSHRLGRVAEDEIESVVHRYGSEACAADAGDVWLYSTPILHASEASRRPGRRRVLQVDYASEPLPGGLEWLGI